MRKVKVENIEKELLELFNNKKEDIIWCIHETPLVFKSRLAELDETWCTENNIKICNSFNFGGTIISDKNDINAAVIRYDGWDVGRDLLEMFRDELSNKVDKLSIDGNDLLYDSKYKVLSYASVNVGDNLIYSCWHISFNPNIDLIKNVCTKEMVKIPKGLDELGVTHQDIIDIFTKWEVLNPVKILY